MFEIEIVRSPCSVLHEDISGQQILVSNYINTLRPPCFIILLLDTDCRLLQQSISVSFSFISQWQLCGASTRTLCVIVLVRFLCRKSHFNLGYGACWMSFCILDSPVWDMKVRIFVVHGMECMHAQTELWFRLSSGVGDYHILKD